jgi:hypothetical protein
VGSQEANFRIHIHFVEQKDQPGDPREEFCALLRRHAIISDPDLLTTSEFETRLEREFGDRLHDSLVEHFHVAWQAPLVRKYFHPDRAIYVPPPPFPNASLLPLVFFEARVLAYHSLELGVAVAGARNLAKLFDDNYELVMMFLRTYVPVAFAQTLYEWRTTDLRFDVVPEPGFRESLVSSAQGDNGSSTARDQPPAMSDRARNVWLIENFLLLSSLARSRSAIRDAPLYERPADRIN